MTAHVIRGKSLPMVLSLLFVLGFVGLLSGCAAANEPASSNEAPRSNDGGEATQPAETTDFTDQTATNSETSRQTVLSHLTVSNANGSSDIRYTIGENGRIDTITRDVSGLGTSTVTYAYDEQNQLIGGTLQYGDTTREFTATATTKQDGANVEYEIVSVYENPPTTDAQSLVEASRRNQTKVEVDYTINSAGNVLEYERKADFMMNNAAYELDESAQFNDEGLIISCESSVEDASGQDSGDYDATFAYSDEFRKFTKTDLRDDGSNESSNFEIAYNEIGKIFRISGGDGFEMTCEYSEVPITSLAASTMEILPMLALLSV